MMKWTSEAPTQAGFYWVKPNEASLPNRPLDEDDAAQVVRVGPNHRGELKYWLARSPMDYDTFYDPKMNYMALWYGPLKEPE